MTRWVEVSAPAKVNLSLCVIGRRPDGYHELDTLMMGLALADRLRIAERAGEDRLRVSGPQARGVPADARNLALRAVGAVRRLARARGHELAGVHVELEKHIPSAAGLGGGSSDAAGAALACAHLAGLDPDEPELLRALGEVGSDCAFFLAARASGLARCRGRGEHVEPLSAWRGPFALLIVTPAFGCATATVYDALPEPAGSRPLDPACLARADLADLRALLHNDLEAAALRSHPALEPFRARLEDLAPGAFHLAGSGSSWFGFLDDEGAARRVMNELARAGSERRYALRGQWLLPATSTGLAVRAMKLH